MEYPQADMADWQIWISSASGELRTIVQDVSWFSVSRIANHPGAFGIGLPGDFDRAYLAIDNIFEFWRNGELFRPYFVRQVIYREEEAVDVVNVYGSDPLDLLRRRIIAYYAGSAQAQKTASADDMIKAIIRENLGASAGTGRDLSSYITVDGDYSLAPSITKSFSWSNLLDICQSICEASRENGTELYFDLEPYYSNNNVRYWFKTAVNQPGSDRTEYVMLGKDFGNIEDNLLEMDYSDEINYVYAGGQGEGADREIVEVSDTERIEISVFNRREGFADARNESTTDGIRAAGEAMLEEYRPGIRYAGRITGGYGDRWDFGDKVSIGYAGYRFDAVIKTIMINVDATGQETVEARVEGELSDLEMA
jgi:hypothetical protein